MSNKQKYIDFCKKEPIPVFSQYWYLDAVAEKWDVILYEKNAEVWASLPYIIKKKGFFTLLSQPKFTQKLGIYIRYPKDLRYYKKLSWEKEVVNAIIDKLPKVDYFKQTFNYTFSNWLPFYWRGFKQTTLYTYLIEEITDLDAFWLNNIQKKSRVAIKKARKYVDVIESDNAEKFYDMVKMTYARQNLDTPYTKEFFLNLDAACKKNNSRKILFAVDKESQEVHVGLYMVYDSNSIYLLASGANPNLRSSGAENLLEWSAIEFAYKEGKILDFEGSMIEQIESHARSLGFKQKPYFQITKSRNKFLEFLACLKR